VYCFLRKKQNGYAALFAETKQGCKYGTEKLPSFLLEVQAGKFD
jgi:hypothetical protein